MGTKTQRARDLGIPFDGLQGKINAITDVAGVYVGQRKIDVNTLHTGVTAILPLLNDQQPNFDSDGTPNQGHGINTLVPAACHSINGCGEMTGTHWIEESGFLNGPILLTNTVSVGTVRDAVIKYSISLQKAPQTIDINLDVFGPLLPVVAETYDGWLNDILSFSVDEMMVKNALDDATNSGPNAKVDEGNVGAGTGTTCYDWKGGIGTASRVVTPYQVYPDGKPSTLPTWTGDPTPQYNVGVLVQANQGTYWDLVIRGVPVGSYIAPPITAMPAADTIPSTVDPANGRRTPTPIKNTRKSSIIVVVATDAPMLPGQLKRLAKRATHGIARTGTNTNDDSGELVIAFSTSTSNEYAWYADKVVDMNTVPNDNLDPFFDAVAQATEEAILNAMVMSDTIEVDYPDGPKHVAKSISDPDVLPTLLNLLKTYNLMNPPASASPAS